MGLSRFPPVFRPSFTGPSLTNIGDPCTERGDIPKHHAKVNDPRALPKEGNKSWFWGSSRICDPKIAVVARCPRVSAIMW